MCCTFNALAAEEIYRWGLDDDDDIGDGDDNDEDDDDDDDDQIGDNFGFCVRASKFSTSVANLQKQNVLDSFERLVHDHVNNYHDPCHNPCHYPFHNYG